MAATIMRWITLLSLILLSQNVGSETFSIQNICRNLPFPQQCQLFLGNTPTISIPESPAASLGLLLQTTLTQALQGLSYTTSLGSLARSEREKQALNDCIELNQQTVKLLTRITSTSPSAVDKQTWLSASLTNLASCSFGFVDLGVTSNIFNLLQNNATKLISNCLALNKVPFFPSSHADGFPKWVRPGDRKLLQSPTITPNVVVAADGSGNFNTVSQAVAAISGSGRFVIYIKAGIYNENVEIKKDNVMLIGDGIGRTIITGDRSVIGGFTTFRSATVAVTGDRFIAQGITFRNTAGPRNQQAVALRSGSDLSVFYNCGFEGYQDTLYAHSLRQFYKNCDIYGTVDFIFGNAAVVIQSCNIYARDPPNLVNLVTAHGRTDPNQNTGIMIYDCNILGSGVSAAAKTFLGRPWKEFSRTVVAKSYLSSIIDPAGWYPWNGNLGLDTLYYGEYMNMGPGSPTAARVSWKGYRVITNYTEVLQFSVNNFIQGDFWLPSTGVPYISSI